MGLMVGILESKSIGNCSNDGISARHDRVVVVEVQDAGGTFHPVEGPFDPREDMPGVRIVRRWAGTEREYLHAEPIDQPEGPVVGPMAGGCYIESSDSRFSRISRYPIPLHDRFETQREHDFLSR